MHLSLVSMHENALRRNGGIGFSISEPKAILEIYESEYFSFSDHRTFSFAEHEINNLRLVVDEATKTYGLTKSISVSLQGDFGTHIGLGSGTAIRLACLEALFKLNEIEIDVVELVKISKRGGTSGVGINTYFEGGLILDLGRSSGLNEITPSSLGRRHSLPISIKKLVMPNWEMGICIPTNIQPKTQEEELRFFHDNTPISNQSSYEASYYALFGIYASVLEQDFANFCKSINILQKSEWKSLERKQYGGYIEQVERLLYKRGARCAGMSSLGPIIYFFHQGEFDFNDLEAFKALGVNVLKSKPQNFGRKLLVD